MGFFLSFTFKHYNLNMHTVKGKLKALSSFSVLLRFQSVQISNYNNVFIYQLPAAKFPPLLNTNEGEEPGAQSLISKCSRKQPISEVAIYIYSIDRSSN